MNGLLAPWKITVSRQVMRQFLLAFAIGIGGFFLAHAFAAWVAQQWANQVPFTQTQLYGIAFAGPIVFVLLMFRKAAGEDVSVLWGAEVSLVAVCSLALLTFWVPNFAIATAIAFTLITFYPTARSAVARRFPLAPKA